MGLQLDFRELQGSSGPWVWSVVHVLTYKHVHVHNWEYNKYGAGKEGKFKKAIKYISGN